MISSKDFNTVMKRAGEKINFSRATLMGKNQSLRDDSGFNFSANRMLVSLENFLDLGSNTKFLISDAIAAGMSNSKQNFSASDLASVNDVEVIDIAIGATVASHGLTYIAMERAADSVEQQVAFQGLKAVNSAAGYTAGDRVIDPRSAIDPKIDMSRNGARSSTTYDAASINAAGLTINIPLPSPGPIVVGETKVKVVLTANLLTDEPTLLAYDTGKNKANANGDVELALTKGGLITDASINLNTGAFVGESVADLSTYTIIVERCFDRIAESDGKNTLKLKPFVDSVSITATENRIILSSSVEVQAQMNKIFRKNAAYGVNADFGKRAIDQIIMLYTYFIDVNIVRQLWEGVKKTALNHKIDLSGFSTSAYSSFASTKNDRLGLFVRGMCSAFLARTGQAITALVVDEVAALMFANDSDNFVLDPAFLQRRDGYIGTYQNIPVVRNIFLNGKGTTANDGVVIGVYKSLDGNAGPVAQVDYLPPYSTLPAINANNPGELAQALFSQTGAKCVCPEWAIRGEITPYTEPVWKVPPPLDTQTFPPRM